MPDANCHAVSDEPDFGYVRETLARALKEAPTAQRELLAATDAAYDYLEGPGQDLTDDQYLDLKMMASQAESILTRYFGM
ncbi:MAG: hypothetical protein JWM80_5131 [Cyanobacteria bacterium RYN_339]|nr:hypothetical protein [Cyanobacteria bacterium RYN_339]